MRMVMTKRDWDRLDAPSRALLLAMALRGDDPWLTTAPALVPLSALDDLEDALAEWARDERE